MKGFFPSSSLMTKDHMPIIARCGKCGLHKHCKSPKMKPFGKGRKKILIVAEAPGRNEDEQGIQLVGDSGKRLEGTLRQLRIDFERDCWRTNAVICHPENNETPSDDKIEACRPNLLNTIKELKPNVIILLGGIAVESLMGAAYKDDVGGITKWAGFVIPCQDPNAWIVPTYHPSYLLRMNSGVLDRLFRKHLKNAIDKADEKPWSTLPKYEDKVEILDPHQAARFIRRIEDEVVSIDYETNCLKPEYERARIVCCSISNGDWSIAYPWYREAIDATSELWLNPKIAKVASNLKFEDRWTRRLLGHPVKNWLWDTMLAAHVIDNRAGITSIKFQAFVQLGAAIYNHNIEPFLKNPKKSKYNRIEEIDIQDLLLYCGLDSLYEYKVAMRQMKILRNR